MTILLSICSGGIIGYGIAQIISGNHTGIIPLVLGLFIAVINIISI